MTFIQAGPVKDMGNNTMKAIKAENKEILVANAGGNFFAIGNTCTHRGCQLSKGKLSGNHVTCPCHGSTFDLMTGLVVKGPAKEPEHSYKVKVENDIVLVDV